MTILTKNEKVIDFSENDNIMGLNINVHRCTKNKEDEI